MVTEELGHCRRLARLSIASASPEVILLEASLIPELEMFTQRDKWERCCKALPVASVVVEVFSSSRNSGKAGETSGGVSSVFFWNAAL